MEPKYFIYIILAIAIFYFRFGLGSRLLKKKSYHYIDPPASTEDPNWIPIEMEDYKSIVLVKINNIKDTVESLRSGIEEDFPDNECSVIQLDEWYVVSVPNLSFLSFHELVFTLSMINDGDIWGYCKHVNTASKDYLVMHDTESEQVNLFGAFRDSTNLGIFLMKSDIHVNGNMSKSMVNEVDFEEEISKLPIDRHEAVTKEL